MSRILIISVAILVFYSNDCHTQSFSWAQSYVGSVEGTIGNSTIDASNSGYTLGAFTGTIDLDQGPGVYNVNSLQPRDMFLVKQDDGGNFLWAKIFHRKSNNNYGADGRSVAIDAGGNIYIVGAFTDTVDFDPGSGVYYMAPPMGSTIVYNGFIVKLNPNGDLVWAKQIGGVGGPGAASYNYLKIDYSGNIILIGGMGGTVDVDPGFNVSILSGSGILMEKIDSSGNLLWAKLVPVSQGATPGMALALDSSDNIFISGFFLGSSVDFDPGPGSFNLTCNGGNGDAFVAKYDSLGIFQWVKQVGGIGADWGQGVSVDGSGNVLVCGHFEGTVDFDPGPGVYNLTSPARSVFTLKLNNNGDFKWATMTGTMGNNEGRAIATDSLGNVYTASLLNGPADLDPGPGSYFVTAGVGIQKLDSSGNFVWGAGVGGDIPGWIGLDNEQSVYCTGSFTGPNKDFDPSSDTYLLSSGGQGSGFMLKLCQEAGTVPLLSSTTTACIGDTILLNAPVVAGATYRWYRNNTLLPDTAATLAATASGMYRVRVGGGSCPSFGINNLTFNPVYAPTISLPTTPMSVAAGQQVNLLSTVVNGGSGYVIDWYRNGLLFTTTTTTYTSYTKGAGTDTILAVVRYPTPNSCFVNDTSGVLLVSETLGVDVLSQPVISLYPNPTMGLFTITAAEPIEQIDIRDVRGALVYEASPQRLQTSINLTAQGSGVYFYRLKVGNGWVRGKVVVR